MPRAKPDPVKHCEICGVLMTRKRFNGRLEDMGVFMRRRRCSQVCANTKLEVTKDAHHWRARKHRKAACEDCATTASLHVHHVDRNPENNDPTNLRTLCGTCHMKLHWREDREKRMRSAKAAGARSALTGASTRKRSADGKFASAG